jgi:hypothetical protein
LLTLLEFDELTGAVCRRILKPSTTMVRCPEIPGEPDAGGATSDVRERQDSAGNVND